LELRPCRNQFGAIKPRRPLVDPPGLPPDVLEKLNAAVNDAATGEALVKRFTEEGAEPFRGSPADFAQVLRSELETWQKVVKEDALKLE
jgi:tripartite-type tricarboxylate transporter receptor subunit TctC